MKIWDNQHYYYYTITITLSFILFLFSALMLIKHVQYENKYYTMYLIDCVGFIDFE